ncbi:methionyl-tRNA formyltransferase [Granulicella sp. 5B5]|uniref:methionyl-tRNA formyltransferase n=1 Tax=Granulicella sp. 5B5 TaxID=1617967 RepID=UPI0015F60DF4|nr:methionyl-tRNA formyltransferase [Granulicella sp. 5B5]QMV18002.1 methionyl-tRNA formyltransferase [Granulicella sp. 5B5]
MKLVFCGTPEFAVPSLQAVVAAGHEVALVLTQPDRPAGRKMELQVPPVKVLALSLGIAVEQPEKLKTNVGLRERLAAIQPDAIIVVAYGRIIPDWMLALPRYGNINVHGSLLPKYRGAAPIQWAVANGETETGITTMRLDAGLDTGDTLLFRSIPIGPDTTSPQLYPQLAHIGAELLVVTLAGLADGSVTPQPQDHSKATLAPILTREDGRLETSRYTAQQAYDRWRGFNPWPGCWAMLRGKRFLLHRIHPVVAAVSLAPGELDASSGELLLGMADGTLLRLDEVQLEGKPRLAGEQFARDYQVKAGERLE